MAARVVVGRKMQVHRQAPLRNLTQGYALGLHLHVVTLCVRHTLGSKTGMFVDSCPGAEGSRDPDIPPEVAAVLLANACVPGYSDAGADVTTAVAIVARTCCATRLVVVAAAAVGVAVGVGEVGVVVVIVEVVVVVVVRFVIVTVVVIVVVAL